MAGWTNKGKYKLLGWGFVAEAIPTKFYMILLDETTAPLVDMETVAEVTQIPTGQGYVDGGYELTPGGVDFDVWTEDDGNDRGFVQIKDIVWTASGGTLPASGNGARYSALTDDHVTIASRELYQYFDLVSNRKVSDTQTLTLQDCEIRINES